MFRVRRMMMGALVVLAVGAGGCATKYEVESDTSWSGFVEDHSVAERGSRIFDAHEGGGAVFTKTTERGFLRARVKGFWGDDRWVETTAPYGSVIVNAQGTHD